VRRLAACMLLTASAWVTAAAPADAGGNLTLTESGNVGFPDRAYVLSLPPGRLADPNQIHVRENGQPVRGVSVLPASAASARGFGVVLVIDSSRSMHDGPIRDAMAAARAFARRRQPNEQLGVVTFNGTATVALPLTMDGGAIKRALAQPPALGRNTHIFDAVDLAVRMLGAARLKPASVVVLSDGSDTGSRVASSRVTTEARKAGVRVFSVGLHSRAFDPGSLRGLAHGSHGTYEEASNPGALAQIYDQLGARLSNEYVVSYRSLAGPNQRVDVSVQLDGIAGLAVAQYKTPALRTQLPPYRVNDFWASAAAPVLVSLLCGFFLAATLYLAFSRPQRRNLRRRVSQFLSAESNGRPPTVEAQPLSSPGLFVGVGRRFEQMRWWPAFEEELDVARIETPATQLAGATMVGTVLVLLLLVVATGSVLVGSVALLIPILVRRVVLFKAQRERKHFADQLADNLQVISSALRAGHSLVGAMSVAVLDAPQPTKREFEHVVADEKLGVSLDEGLTTVARRMRSRDLEQVVLVASLQRETGGNTAEVLDRVADTVRERAELRRMIRTLTAQGRMSRWIVTALPVFLCLAITALNPGFMRPLFQTPVGHALIVLGLIMLVSGSLVIKRIVTIEV
jgi:tight adherence protein B